MSTLDEILGVLLEMDVEGEGDAEHLCGCGTPVEAIDTALHMLNRTLEHQCPVWFLQVATAQMVIAKILKDMDVGGNLQRVDDQFFAAIKEPSFVANEVPKIMKSIADSIEAYSRRVDG